MATYTFEIGDEEWDVEAPDDASPKVLKQIAASLMDQRDLPESEAEAALPEEPPSNVSNLPAEVAGPTPTTTITSDTPQLPSAGMLPTVLGVGGAVGAPLIAAAGGGTPLALGLGAAWAMGAQALKQYVEQNTFEATRTEYSPARIAAEGLMTVIPVKGAKSAIDAVKEGAKLGGLTTAGITTADYFDTGKLPTIKETGLNFFLGTLMGTLGSRVMGAVERDLGPEVANRVLTADDLKPLNELDIPADRFDEFLDIEKGPSRWGQLDVPEEDFPEFLGIPKPGQKPPAGTKGPLEQPISGTKKKRGRPAKTVPKQTPAEAAATTPDNPSDEEITAFLEAQGVSARDPNTSASNLISQIQRDVGVPVSPEGPSSIGTIYNEIEAAGPPAARPNTAGRVRSTVGPRGRLGMRPMEGVIADLSAATNTNAYDDYAWLVRNVELKRQYEDLWAGHGTKDQWGLTKIFRWTTAKTRRQMTEYLESADKAVIAEKYGWNDRTLRKAEQLKAFYDKFFIDFNVDPKMFWENYAPRIRKFMGSKDIGAVSEDPRVPKDILPFFKHARTGHLDMYETDALKAAARYLRVGTFEKFMGPRWEALRAKYYKLYNDPELTKKELGKEFLGLLETVKGPKTDAMHVAIQDTIDSIAKRLGASQGFDAHVITENLLNMQNLAYLGGNIPSLVRDSFQPMLTAYPKLGTWLWKGFKAAATAEGSARAQVAGITRGMTTGMHDVLSISRGPITRMIRASTKAGMSPRQMNESFGRSAVYNGMRLKALDALEKSRLPKWTDQSDIAQLRRFMDYADIDRFHPEVQKDIAAHFLLKDPDSAIDTAARQMVNETMFDYTAVGRPKLTRNTAGKLGLTYSVWPASYWEYLGNFRKFGADWKIKRDVTRLILSHGAIVGTFGGLGVMAGDSDAFSDAMNQAFYGPTMVGLSGIGNLALTATEVARGAPGAEGKMKYQIKGLYPGAGMVRNIKQIQAEQSLFRKAGRLTGFVRGQEKGGTRPVREVIPIAGEENFFRRALPNPFKE